MLLRRLKDKTTTAARQVVLQPSLVIRESSLHRGRAAAAVRNGRN
jgi:DNA-binding LacI/PurR family transcriptional regulator